MSDSLSEGRWVYWCVGDPDKVGLFGRGLGSPMVGGHRAVEDRVFLTGVLPADLLPRRCPGWKSTIPIFRRGHYVLAAGRGLSLGVTRFCGGRRRVGVGGWVWGSLAVTQGLGRGSCRYLAGGKGIDTPSGFLLFTPGISRHSRACDSDIYTLNQRAQMSTSSSLGWRCPACV